MVKINQSTSKYSLITKKLALLKFVCLFLGLSTYYLLLTTPQAYAEGISLGVAPPIIQIDATVPASIKTPITVENNGSDPVTLQILLKAFTASDAQNGFVKYYSDTDPLSKPHIFDYIQFAQNGHNVSEVNLAPKETKTLEMHIGIPEKEPIDDYYFSVIFLSKQSEEELKNTSSKTPAGIATNVLLSLGPKGETTGQIEEFSTPFFVDHGPVPFTLRLKNTSDHYIAPHGEILLKNMFGQTIGKVNLLPVNILSHTIRSIPDMLFSPDASQSSHFIRPQTRFEAAVWPETFLLGPYTAELAIALSDQGPVFRRTIYFFAFPLYLALMLLLLIIIGIFIYLRVKKRLR